MEARADVSLQDARGWLALHWAAAEAHLAIVRLLVEVGADHEATTAEGETPYDVAGSLETKLYLREGEHLQYPDLGPCGSRGLCGRTTRVAALTRAHSHTLTHYTVPLPPPAATKQTRRFPCRQPGRLAPERLL